MDNSNNNRSLSDTCFKHLSCFNSLSEDELKYVNQKTRHLFFGKGETVLKQGLSSPYIVFLTKGLVKIYIEAARNKHLATHLAKAGDFLSFSAVFSTDINKFSASALSDSDICLIDRDAIIHLLKTNSDFAYRIISKNWKIENQLLDIINNLSYKQMPGKLASAILYLNDSGHENVFDYMSRKDIAEYANISTESTVKLLKEFEGEGLLSLKGKRIEILDKESLTEISIKG